MKYIRSRSSFLNDKKYNLILEGGLENDINWGDSLVGRLFMSVVRVGSSAINSKRLDGLGNSLRKLLLDNTMQSYEEENPELKEELTTFQRELYLLSVEEGLLDVLKTGKIKDIQLYMEGMSDEDIEEIINHLTGENQDSIDILLAIQGWKEPDTTTGEKEPDTTTGDNDQEDIESKKELNTFVTNYVTNITNITNNTNTNNISNVYNKKSDLDVNTILTEIREKLEKVISNTEKIDKIEKYIKDIDTKMKNPDIDTKTNIDVSITNIINIIESETGEKPEVKKPEFKKSEVKDNTKTEDDKNIPSVNIGLLKFLRLGGIETPEYKVENGKVISKMTSDRTDAGPNAGWIVTTRKATPRKFLNRFVISFPEMNLVFDGGVRIKSMKPGKDFNKNQNQNMDFYFDDPKTKKKKSIKLDLSDDRSKWNYVINDNRKEGDKHYIKLSDNNINELNKNKTKIFDLLGKIWSSKYNIRYKHDPSKINKSIEDFDKSKKSGDFGDDRAKGEEKEIKGEEKEIKEGLLIEYYSEEDGYIYTLNEVVFSDYFQGNVDKIGLTINNDIIEEITSDTDSKPFKYNFWINNSLKPVQVVKKKVEIEKTIRTIETKVKEPKYVINVLDIVKIFKKASRIYIKTVVPSLRTDGKLTRAVANKWETVEGGSIDPDKPSGGPFRNIKLYEKWNRIVLDIINEFDYALKPEDSRIILSNGGDPIKPKKSIYQFITDALDGDKISGYPKDGSNQHQFLLGYFGEEEADKMQSNISKTKTKIEDLEGKEGVGETDNGPKEETTDDESKEPKTYFEKVDIIDWKKSNLYKVKTIGSFKMGDTTLLPQSTEGVIYIYVSKPKKDEDDAVVYISENPMMFKNYNNTEMEYPKIKTPDDASKNLLVSYISSDVKTGGIGDKTNFIDHSNSKLYESNSANIDIQEISKYSDPDGSDGRMKLNGLNFPDKKLIESLKKSPFNN